MILAAVHWFVKFRNRQYQLGARRNPERGGPMLVHSMKKVYEPLAGNIVAYEDEGEGKCVDYERDDEIHVRISMNASALIIIAIALKKNAPFTFLQVPNTQRHNHLRPTAHYSADASIAEALRKLGIHLRQGLKPNTCANLNERLVS